MTNDPLAPFRPKSQQPEAVTPAQELPTPGEKTAAWFHDDIINHEGDWSEERLAEKIDAVIAEEKLNLEAENARLEAENMELLETISSGTAVFTLASMEGVVDGATLIKEELEKFNGVLAKYAQQEPHPMRDISTYEPERNRDIEPEM